MKRWTFLGPSVPALFFVFYPVSGTVTMLPQITPEILLLPGEQKKGGAGSLRGRRRFVPGGGGFGGASTGRDESRRNLVTGGTPTGGGKYPFLVLVSYTNGSGEDTGPSPSPVFPVAYCHGVMVARDILLRPAWCDNMGMPLMVGDYDKSSSNSSVQFIDLRGERTIVTSADGALALEKVGPVTMPGFVPVPIANDTSEPIPDGNLTVVGYGSNSSWDEYGGDITFPGVAMEASLQAVVPEYCKEAGSDSGTNYAVLFCAAAPAGDPPFSFQAAGPCYGDLGAPVLNDKGTLVGMATEDARCDNRVIPSKFIRISFYASWIFENTCVLSHDTEFNSCPSSVCPPEERVLGYPWASVPNATTKIKTTAGFEPIKVVQSPQAGSLINTSTTVLVLLTDQSGNVSSCPWTVTVPGITVVAGPTEDIASGTYDRNISLLFESDALRQGLAVMITAQLDRRLDGNASVTVRTVYNETVTLSGVVSEATLALQQPFLFQYGVNDVTLLVRDSQQGNYLSLQVFGQDKPIEGQGEDEGDAGVPERS